MYFFQDMRYISWNEFVHLMLAKGEVEEIIARPDLDIVTIRLFEGAIIKGRKVNIDIYEFINYFSAVCYLF